MNDKWKHSFITLITFIIFTGCILNDTTPYKYTKLHEAVKLGKIKIVNSIVKNNPDINKTDNFGETPLVDAVRYNYNNITLLLLCNGADKNVSTIDGVSLSTIAIRNDNQQIFNFLQEHNNTQLCNNINIDINISTNNNDINISDSNDTNISNLFTSVNNPTEIILDDNLSSNKSLSTTNNIIDLNTTTKDNTDNFIPATLNDNKNNNISSTTDDKNDIYIPKVDDNLDKDILNQYEQDSLDNDTQLDKLHIEGITDEELDNYINDVK